MRDIALSVKNSAYEIIERKKASYYGIAMSVRRICEAIIKDEKTILPVSRMMHGTYGMKDVVLSMPAVIGKDGIESSVPISLAASERQKLMDSAQTLKTVAQQVCLCAES